MKEFFESYLYFITLVIIIGTTIWIGLDKRKIYIKIKNNQSIISYSLASLQLIAVISFYIYNISEKGYHHILATDLCPFVELASIIIFFIQRKSLYKMIMPWLILGSGLTMIAATPGFTNEGVFMGFVSFFKHTLMMIQGIFIWIIVDKYKRKDVFLVAIFIIGFIVWVLIGALIPWKVTGDDKWAVYSTALLKPAVYETKITYNGQTTIAADYAFLGDIGPYPWMTIIFYILAIAIVSMMILAKNYWYEIYKKLFNKNKSKQK